MVRRDLVSGLNEKKPWVKNRSYVLIHFLSVRNNLGKLFDISKPHF